MNEQRDSNLQEYTPNNEQQENHDDEEIIREENNHADIYQAEENLPISSIEHEENYSEPPKQDENKASQNEQQNLSYQNISTNKLEYENVRVSFPTSTDSGINSYMIYKVKYSWQNKNFIVNRRFSDFTALRNSLRKYLPCHYIFPVHKKKTIV